MARLPDAIQSRLLELPDGLRAHIERVRDVGKQLARRYDEDLERIALGVAAHDLFRASTSADLLEAAHRLDIDINPIEQRMPMLLHGPVASRWIEENADITDTDILESVHWHTTGREDMSKLAKVVFLADKLDPQKIQRYAYLEKVNILAQENLDAAILEYLNQNLAYFVRENKLIHPASLYLRNQLMVE